MSSFSARASWFNIGRRGTPKRSCSMSVIRCCETVSPLRPLILAASSIWVRPSSSRRRAMSSPKDFTLLSPHVLSLNRQTSHGSFFFHLALLHIHESAFLPSNPNRLRRTFRAVPGKKRPGPSRNLTPLFLRKRRAARKGRKKAPGAFSTRARTAGADLMIVRGDARRIPLRDETVQCVMTSPPYFQLRDYQCGRGQIGLEATPEAYIAALVEVFREVWRVLRHDGVLWLVLGDSHWGTRSSQRGLRHPALKPKDLIGIPWRVALALQADGWYLRADVIWSKPNPMPEPVRDRPTRSHEYVFLLSKSRRYYYDAVAIAEPAISDHPSANRFVRRPQRTHGNRGNSTSWTDVSGKRNRRDVWQFKSEPTTDAHYATFPTELAQICILAGSQPEDLVLDPFAGSGTVGKVCERLARRWIGIELSTKYGPLARQRTAQMGLPFKCLPGREAALYPDANGGGAVFGLGCSPEGRSLWGKPGLGGFEPARGGAPIEAAWLCER